MVEIRDNCCKVCRYLLYLVIAFTILLVLVVGVALLILWGNNYLKNSTESNTTEYTTNESPAIMFTTTEHTTTESPAIVFTTTEYTNTEFTTTESTTTEYTTTEHTTPESPKTESTEIKSTTTESITTEYSGVIKSITTEKIEKQLALNTLNETCFHQDIRLPLSIKPSFYNVTIHPNLNVAPPFYNGHVDIHVDCLQSTRNIIFHSINLTIINIKVEKIILLNNKTNKILVNSERPILHGKTMEWEECPSLKQINIPLKETVEFGDKLLIRVRFIGLLKSNPNDGFYLSNYIENGKNWTMATTQMEPDHARQAFPCFDEPEMKAIFQFQIVRDKNYFSLFNTKMIKSVKFDDNFVMDLYEKSEIMSSYLVAFTVCPNNYTPRKQLYRNISLRFFAPRSQRTSLSHAMNVTVEVLKHFEELFGINYSMNKLDQIVIHNYQSGAMENWGLITYSTGALLYDPNERNEQHKLTVTKVVTHELAHQWFGNIVTMKWWNDIWLNEAFANYLECDYLEEKMKNRERFGSYLSASSREIRFYSRPVALPNNYTDNGKPLDELFDFITYAKGGFLLAMMENFMGKENMVKGMRIYLNRHRYKNAIGDDLWNAMKEACDSEFLKNELDTIMKSWFEQAYFPIIHINFHNDSKSFTASQERFQYFKSDATLQSKYGFLWQVPLKYTTSHNATANFVWLQEKEQTFALDESASWIKMNVDHRGYFITNYDTATWKHIVDNIQNENFDEINSAGILFDIKWLLITSKIDISIVLDLVSSIYSRTEYFVWTMAGQIINDIYQRLHSHEHLLPLYKNQLNEMIVQVLQARGYFWNQNDTNFEKVITDAFIFSTALMANETNCSSYAMKEFEKTLINASYEINEMEFQYGIANSRPDAWEVIWNRYKTSSNKSNTNKLLSALSASRDWNLLEKLLQDGVNRKDKNIPFIVKQISQNLHFSEKMWEFFLLNSEYFIENHANELGNILNYLCARLKTTNNYKSVQTFFEKNSLENSVNKNRNLETILMNIEWEKTYLNEIEKYYKSKL